MHIAASTKFVRQSVSPEEWTCRVELAAFYRIVHALGLTDSIYNHITARVPGTLDQFLINPFGLDYSEITASSLVKVDLNGDILLQPPHGYGVNKAGFVIHSAIHAARHDLFCIAHTHSRAGVAVSCLESGLLPLNQNALRFHGDLAYHDYEGPAVYEDERARLVADLGECDNMILRNHGLIAAGPSIAHAYVSLYALEKACQMQVDALACGQPIRSIAPYVLEGARRIYLESKSPKSGLLGSYAGPRMEWAAAVRVLDATTISYRN